MWVHILKQAFMLPDGASSLSGVHIIHHSAYWFCWQPEHTKGVLVLCYLPEFRQIYKQNKYVCQFLFLREFFNIYCDIIFHV